MSAAPAPPDDEDVRESTTTRPVRRGHTLTDDLPVGWVLRSQYLGRLTVALVCAGCGRRDQAVGVRSYVPGHGELFGF